MPHDMTNSQERGTKAAFQEETSNTMLLGESWSVGKTIGLGTLFPSPYGSS